LQGEAVSSSEIIFVVEESPEGGYEAEALGESIFTQAETLGELRTMVQGTVRNHFDEDDRLQVIHLHLVHDEVLLI
jgi:hypothetical protein|tara:strand:+ start:100 stop:327 length:228 start_codon:yes stop_codon:yes gene_type:complete